MRHGTCGPHRDLKTYCLNPAEHRAHWEITFFGVTGRREAGELAYFGAMRRLRPHRSVSKEREPGGEPKLSF
jgi:hypothetical protein